MKRIIFWVVIVAFLALAGSALADEPINLIGTWEGTYYGARAERGFTQGTVKLVIDQQEGRVFSGYKELTHSNGTIRDDCFGAIDRYNKKIYFVEKEDGYLFGDIIWQNEMDVYSMEDGSTTGAHTGVWILTKTQ